MVFLLFGLLKCYLILITSYNAYNTHHSKTFLSYPLFPLFLSGDVNFVMTRPSTSPVEKSLKSPSEDAKHRSRLNILECFHCLHMVDCEGVEFESPTEEAMHDQVSDSTLYIDYDTGWTQKICIQAIHVGE